MVPIWVLIIAIGVSMIIGGTFVSFLRVPRRGKEVDRTQERPLNFFDAYSDEDLEKQRTQTADTIRRNRVYGYNIDKHVAYLRKVDNEITVRKNAKLALEETRRTQHERDIAIFDTVYGEVLKNTERNR